MNNSSSDFLIDGEDDSGDTKTSDSPQAAETEAQAVAKPPYVPAVLFAT